MGLVLEAEVLSFVFGRAGGIPAAGSLPPSLAVPAHSYSLAQRIAQSLQVSPFACSLLRSLIAAELSGRASSSRPLLSADAGFCTLVAA